MILNRQIYAANYSQASGFSIILIYTFDPIEMSMDESEFLQS